MFLIESLIALAVAVVFYLLGLRSAKVQQRATEDVIHKTTEKAISEILKLQATSSSGFNSIRSNLSEAQQGTKSLARHLTNIDRSVAKTQKQMNTLPEAADRMRKNSSQFVRTFEGLRDGLKGSIEDIKTFASTITLLEQNGFELITSQATPKQREELGELPTKVFVFFPKKALRDEIFSAVLASSATVLVDKVVQGILDRLDTR